MTFIMATEAQRLISMSLTKIATSRCARGGVSLHKNLLVATVLQKARYIFMEEAFHMVHGTYLNQASSKFIQQMRDQEQLEFDLRQSEKEFDNNDDTSTASLSDSELDLFSTPISNTNDSLNFLSESEKETGNASNKFNTSTKESNPSLASTSADLIYLDLDRVKPQENEQSSNSISGQKRRLEDTDDFETEEAILSILPKTKQIKLNEPPNEPSSINNNDITTDNCLSLDFLSNDLSLTSSPTHTAPLDMSCSNNSNIDRITSLVSIFNFGNLQRSVSTPDLCSSSSSHHSAVVDNSCCSLSTQRQIAMTV